MIINGNSLEILKGYPSNHFDSVVTDPPYGLSFMNKKWDYDVPTKELWAEVFRVLKPGGHLLAFAGTRTQHRMAVNIEDAGFEIRDMIAWVYGSGFPKSLNIGKAVDKLQGNEREDLGESENNRDRSKHEYNSVNNVGSNARFTIGNSPYEGWGTALKPALEPITVARKPIKGSVASNALEWGTGGINIDGCRVEAIRSAKKRTESRERDMDFHMTTEGNEKNQGRFPANFIHDGSDEVVGLFPDTGGGIYSKQSRKRKGFMLSGSEDNEQEANAPDNYGDSGSAARFFYCAKSSKSERNKGLEGFANIHPTIKPVRLMQYLVRLVTPKGGLVLDPFNGSGTTGIACKLEDMKYVGIELDPEYVKISKARVAAWELDAQTSLL